MNQNVIIGIVVVLILLGGGYFLLTMNPATDGTTATTTPPITTDDNTTTPPPAQSTRGVPGVVTDSGAAPSNSTVVVTGKVTPNGAPTSYWYEYGETSALGARTASQGIGSGWTAIPSPAYITGLRANTAYYFRLSAQNAYGTVNGSTYSFSTNSNPPPQGNPPSVSANAATDVERTTATLNARVNPRGSQTTYWFEYGTDANFGSLSSFQPAGNGTALTAVSASVSGLSPATKYFFRVNAQNQFGTVNGPTQNFTTKGPAVSAPSVNTQNANKVEATTATLRGTVDPNGGETTYWFEYSSDSLLGSLLLKTTARVSAGSGTNPDSVEADVSGLNSNTTYYFRIVAQNNQGTVRGDRESFKTK
ncbi:MAG: hypothetical protein A2854_02795 [Parcubacteria group bacterium RIFCSPHIGHO2_01_FULL_56_18]|nr:MAG: hypothetical protein A2854_02795 [Parcubacteria group bacterium RIFCSPHIGHO2_01_FULL_56_18]